MNTTEKPVVSIVIPVYNQRIEFFQQALDSALAQTFGAVEIVVSDNHSTNDLPAYLATRSDPRLRVVRPPLFLPMVEHFRFAADQAVGEWILYLCSDDWLYPHCVESLLKELSADSEDVVAAYGEVETVETRDLTKVRFYFNRRETGVRTARESLNELLRARPFFAWIPGGMMRRSAYNQVRHVMAGHITFAFDLALLFSLHEFGRLVYVNRPVAKYRDWTPQEGKLGGSRIHKNIIDLGQVCTIIEESPVLTSYLDADLMSQWRLYQANRMWLTLLIEFFNGGSSGSKCQEGIAAVNQYLHAYTPFANLVSWLIRYPQVRLTKPLMQGTYMMFRRLQATLKKPF